MLMYDGGFKKQFEQIELSISISSFLHMIFGRLSMQLKQTYKSLSGNFVRFSVELQRKHLFDIFDIFYQMVSNQTTAEIFRRLREDEENRTCFDCDDIDITYASVNLGILLCEKCAFLHRPLGINISCIKSLKEPWTTRHLRLMTAGGHSALRNFFALYKIPSDSPNEFKYRTMACEYYREMLKMMAEGESIMMVTPSEEEGSMMMEEFREQKNEVKSQKSGRAYRNSLEVCEKKIEELKGSDAFAAIKGLTTEAFCFMSKGFKWGTEKSKEGLEWGTSQGKTLMKKLSINENLVGEANKMYHKVQENLNFSAFREETLKILREIERQGTTE